MPPGGRPACSQRPGFSPQSAGMDAHCWLAADQGASPMCEACEVSLAPGDSPTGSLPAFHSLFECA